MTPVINPWVFYWIEVVDDIHIIAIITLVILVAVSGFILLLTFIDEGISEVIREVSRLKRYFVIILTLIVVLIFVPSSETITKMLIAQNVTYERIEVTSSIVQTVYEDIMELFKESKE